MIEKLNIKGIFFDLHGTLLICEDPASAWAKWFSTFYNCLKDHGLSLAKQEFRVKCDDFFGKEEPKIDKKNATVFEKRIISLCNDLQLILTDQQVQDTALKCVQAWQGYMKLDSDAIHVLKTLKKRYKLALISNFDHPPHIHSILSDLKLINYFDSIVISAEVGVKKPDPTIFSFALKETGIYPNNCVYVGDENIDSIGAKAAGIHSITIKQDAVNVNQHDSFYKLNQNKKNVSDFTISKLTALIEMFI